MSKKEYHCIWKGERVQPTATLCFWLFGPKPKCFYEDSTEKGRCRFLRIGK